MRKIVYPAVLFHDDENNIYVMSIDDLYIVGEGDTVEEVHENVQDALYRYVEGTLRYDLDLVEPTRFDDIRKKYPNKLVMLVECSVDDNNKVLKA